MERFKRKLAVVSLQLAVKSEKTVLKATVIF